MCFMARTANQASARPNAQAPPLTSLSEMASINFTVDSGAEEHFGRAPYDVPESQDIMGNPNRDDVELWGEAAAAFIASAPGGYGPGWVGKRPLGQGGFGRAGLWELLDDEGNVKEVLIVVPLKPLPELAYEAHREWSSKKICASVRGASGIPTSLPRCTSSNA